MSWLPELPAEVESAEGTTTPRYEDLSQDGRLRLEGVWPALGQVFWGSAPLSRPMNRIGIGGIRAVLAHVVMEGDNLRLALVARAEHRVDYRLAHVLDGAGAVQRILFETWLTTRAPAGAPYGERQPRDAPLVGAARAYGLHVFTRPAAAAGEHRVLALPGGELPPVPGPAVTTRAPGDALRLPAGAELLEPAPVVDAVPTAFGLVHTDGNQHVNFLVYPRQAEDLALRRLAEGGHSTRVLARRLEISYRRPTFAGDRARWVTQLYRDGTAFGMLGVLVPDAPELRAAPPAPAAASDATSAAAWAAFGRPYCALRLELQP